MQKNSQKSEVKKAESKVSDYREKFVSRKLTFKDLPKSNPAPMDIPPDDLKGGDWIGEGVERLF